MSRTRQAPFILRGLAIGFPAGTVVPSHSHDWAQLVHARSGVLEVVANRRRRVVPPGRALWIPGGVEHHLVCVDRVELRTLYLPTDRANDLPRAVGVVPVSALLRELIEHAIAIAPLTSGVEEHERLAGFVVDLLSELEPLALELPWPEDERAIKVADQLWAHPSDPATIHELATFAGTSARTLERTFRRETGMALGQWRRQARLLAAVRALGQGRAVTDVAFDVGYASTSAFVAMFRGELGVTPGSLLRR